MNIKRILYGTLSIAAIASMSVSCTQYLDIKPYDKVIPETAEEFSALLHTHLNSIDEGNQNYLVPNFSQNTSFDACFADDFEVCLTETGGVNLHKYIGSYISANTYNNYYEDSYKYIRDCNIVLHNMVEEGTEESDKIRATAYAMRGVAYYQLLRLFCEVPQPGNYENQLGVPIVTTFDMEATPPRSSMAQTISQIESDLLTAMSYKMNDQIFRFTEDVAKGYLARLYFWSRRWSDCLEVCGELLAAHPLLDRQAFVAMMSESKLSGNQLIKAYRSSSVSGSTSLGGTLSLLSYRPVSLRYISNFYGDETTTDIRYGMYVNTKRQARKPVFCGMRSAEFKLMEAECLYHLNRHTEALQSINELRALRIEDYKNIKMEDLPSLNPKEIMKVDVNGENITPLLGMILRERRKELFLEGDRFFELKRNGSPEFTTYYNGVKYTTLSYMYTLPIPIRDLDVTGNLVQNPGYTEIVNKY